ncbi:MAG: carboxypeptidase regulatory-like domain-containing protein, partial [Gemmatimonadetes bacterium]|nr:carboxypeptidase regulatory-like domain-containing protein [Gemmatimonadota bacterium]
MTRSLRALALLATLAASSLHAQSVVTGRALAPDGSAVPLSVVRLLPGKRTALTDQRGAFRFDSVQPGRYRLQMERIGYTAPPSAEFAVVEGAVSEHTLRAAMQPVVLEGVSNGPPACYTRDRLHEAPAVQALWREAQKGLEQRSAFAERYAYRFDTRMRGVARLRLLRDRRLDRDSTVVVNPDSARARRERFAREGLGSQKGNSFSITVPDELYLLADDFLATHCLEANPRQDSAGTWALRYRPVRTTPGVVDLAGTIHLDGRGYAVRRLEYRYLRGRSPWASAAIEYGDVATPFGTMRMRRSGWLRADPAGLMGVVVS